MSKQYELQPQATPTKCLACQVEVWRGPMAKYCGKCRSRNDRLRESKFGGTRVTVEEVVAMERAQGGLCAICGRPPTGKGSAGKTLNVDHCHRSGKLRGLLCFNCNVGIGHLREDVSVFARALAYLDNHAKRQGLR